MTANDSSDVTELIPEYLKRLKDNSEDVEALFELGKISMQIGRSEEARNFLARTVVLEPWHSEARKLLDAEQAKLSHITLSDVVNNVRTVLQKECPEIQLRCQESRQSPIDEYYGLTRPEIQQLVKSSARRILDVGCAAGMLGCELKQKLGAEVWGVEYTREAAEQATKILDRVYHGSIEEILPQLPDGFFDTIICADVLEHLVDPWQVLSKLRNKLALDGELVASIPNIRYWPVVRGLLEGRWPYEDAGILDRTHLRFFTRAECLLLFEKAGYVISRSEAIVLKGDEPVPSGVVQSLQKAGLAVGTLADEGLHYQYAFVAKPAPDNILEPVSRIAQEPGLTSIILLTWNQLPFTQACLASIAENTSEAYELIVIDNGSNDGTVSWLRDQAFADARIHLIENSLNRGFAAACNQGIATARGENILLLNNDTVVTAGWLSGLREVLDRYPDVGIVGPMTNSASGVQVVADALYERLDDMPAWAASFRERYRHRVIPHRRIVGFCMLFKRELVSRIGLLDESFGPGNYEDDDFCLRAELDGYRNLVVGDVYIHHEGGATFSGNRLDRSGEIRKNREVFKKKWEPSGLEESLLRSWLVLDAIEEGERLLQRGEGAAAVEKLLNGAIKADPRSPSPYIKMCEVLMTVGRHEEALHLLSEMPTTTDHMVIAEIEALCHTALGDDEAGWQAALHARQRPHVLVALGTISARKGDLVQAEMFFREAIAADPSCGKGWLSLAMLLWSQGKQGEAFQAVKRSVTVDPLNSEAVRILMDMGQRLDQRGDVLKVITTAAQLYPENRDLAWNHVEILAECGFDAAALEACEAFLVCFGVDEHLLTLALGLRETMGVYARPPEPGKKSVSLCMIVKNEEKHLACCLASAKPVVDEIIVVDTGSSDRTTEIAAAFGARLSSFDWNGDFSDARNHSIEKAAGDWILVLDADEVVSRRDYPEILRSVTSAKNRRDAWSVVTRNYTAMTNAQGWIANDGVYPGEEAADGWYPSWKVRLFPRLPVIRFSGGIHEMVESSLRKSGFTIRKTSFVVHHYGELTSGGKEYEKQLRYFESGMKKLNQNPDDPVAISELAVQAGELGRFEEAVALWDRILKQAPDIVEALFNKGYCLIGLKRYEEALVASRRAVELDPFHKEAAFNYGTCELYVGDPQRALKLVRRVAEQNLEYPLLQALMAVLCFACGLADEGQEKSAMLRSSGYGIDSYIMERISVLERLGRSALAESLGRIGVGQESRRG